MRRTSTALLAAVVVTSAASFDLAASAHVASSDEASKASEMSGEVVTVDVEGKTLKIRLAGSGEGSGELNLGVEGDALAALKDLAAGQQVVVTCREGTSGESCAVTSIKKPDAGPSA